MTPLDFTMLGDNEFLLKSLGSTTPAGTGSSVPPCSEGSAPPSRPCSSVTERWLLIPGREGVYEASTQGRVRSLDRLSPAGRRIKGRMLTPGPSRKGHLYVNLSALGVSRTVTVHSLVLLTFVGPRPNGLLTRHLNGVPSDNRLENLRYGTPKENAADDFKHGVLRGAGLTHCRRGHELFGDNIRWARGERICLTCKAARDKACRTGGTVIWDDEGSATILLSTGAVIRPSDVNTPGTCRNGHERTPESTRLFKSGARCLICYAAKELARQERRATTPRPDAIPSASGRATREREES